MIERAEGGASARPGFLLADEKMGACRSTSLRRCIIAIVSLMLASNVIVAAELSPGAVRAAEDYSMQHGGLSFLATQNGRTLLERYADGASADMELRIYSGTKAFWSLAALAAVEDGLLNLDEHVADTIPQWRHDKRKASVTIRQLLDFDSGLEPNFSLQESQAGNRDEVAIRGSMVAEPGAAFIYGPAALQVFHRVLKEKGQSPSRFLERRVLHRLGLGSQRYLEDRAGNPLLASGFVLTARQWSKLGELVLRNGAPVISPSLLEECWRGPEANRMFAFGWWNNRAATFGREIDVEKMLDRKWQDQDWRNGCLCRDAPRDLVACIGSGHQRLYVIPSLRLIVVRQGDGGSFLDGSFLRILLHGQSP
jgi:CubicO group peptidase (beta-lactamase class C family)